MEQDVTAEGGSVAPEIGLWLTAAALAIIVLGGILTLIESPDKKRYPDPYNYSSGVTAKPPPMRGRKDHQEKHYTRRP